MVTHLICPRHLFSDDVGDVDYYNLVERGDNDPPIVIDREHNITDDHTILINYSMDNYDGTYGVLLNTKTRSGKIYIFLNLICILYYFIPLIWIIKYRNWYIFKQRNFALTFIGGIANFICTFSNSVTPILKMPCAVSYYSATVATSIMQVCYVFRAFRLILLYKLNIFKVTILNQNKFIKNSKEGTLVEPNIYYKSIYKLVNRRIAYITIPIIELMVLVVSIGFHILANIQHGPTCGLKLVSINNRINGEFYAKVYMVKNNIPVDGSYKLPDSISTFPFMRSMFRIPEVLTFLFIGICLIIVFIFTFTEIKDDQKFGIKFDCISSAIISILIGIFYFYLKFEMDNILLIHKERSKDVDLSSLHQIYLRTKQGIIFFVIIGLYIQLTSVIIPLIQCIYTEKLNKKFSMEPVNEMACFYKVLQNPEMVEELKSVAVQEFCVENVLFWENYCILKKLVTKVIRHHKEVGGTVDRYDLFSLQDILYSESGSSSSPSEDSSYDPNYPLFTQLVPYFNSFYYTFIDIDGPAAVNITANTITRINYDLNTYPTVGLFDDAKDEVVETMFFSIYPIFLQQHRDELGKLFANQF